LEDKYLFYLVEHKNKDLRKVEKEACSCLKTRSLEYISNHYPKCVSISTNKAWSGKVIDAYWDVVGDYMKEHYPELLMEAYMTVV
jgi:hypothetical protein